VQSSLFEHLDLCKECTDWAETYRWFSAALIKSAGAKHPTSDQLARYSVDFDRLVEPEQRLIEEHLDECRRCAREVGLTKSAVSGSSHAHRLLGFVPLRADAWSPIVRDVVAASLVFTMLSIFFIYQARRPESDVRWISETRLSGSHVIEAGVSLDVGATTIESGSDITLRAGETVALGNGFSIGKDAHFTVEIVQDPQQIRPGTKQSS
jgi:hypothetical protein